jgi:hypothetical protein
MKALQELKMLREIHRKDQFQWAFPVFTLAEAARAANAYTCQQEQRTTIHHPLNGSH